MSVRPFARQRPLVCSAVLFGAGIWLGMQKVLPLGCLLGGLLICACWGAVLKKRNATMLYAVLACMFFAGGAYVTALNAPALPENGKYQITGYVSGDVQVREDGFVQTYLRDVEAVDEQGARVQLSKVYWGMTADDFPETVMAKLLHDGDRVTFSGKMYVPQGQMNPYGFDFALYLRQQHVRMAVSGNTDLRITRDARRDFAGAMYALRECLGGRMDAIFGDAAVYPRALLLGDKRDLPDETRDVFADLGIAHVLAVSGLHVGLITAMLMFFLRPFRLRDGQKLTVLGIFLFLYAAMLGFSAPVVRSGILLLFAQGRRMVRRSHDPLTLLAAAFLLILLAEPFNLTSLSFQMTFGAVGGMLLLNDWLARFDFARSKIGKALISCVGAMMGVYVPMVNTFHRFSLIGVLVSPLATALMSVLLPLYALVFVLGCLYLPLGQALSSALHGVLHYLPVWMEHLAKAPYASVRVPAVPWMIALALIGSIWIWSRYVTWTVKVKRSAVLIILLLSISAWQLTLVRDVCYIQLYAGQADCALIADDGETVVIDTGTNGRDLSGYLLSTGRNADTLILTHLHSDHAGGVARLLEDGIRIGQVLIPENAMRQQIDEEGAEAIALLQEAGVCIREASAGDAVTLPSGQITFVWPYAPRPGQDANQSSLVSLVELEGVRILTTGDLTGEYEQYAAQQADVLKVAHHGSAGSSSEAFLRTVSPQVSLISCAPDRVLPAEETLERLKAQKTEVLRLDEQGAVTIRIHDGTYTVASYRGKDE